MDNTLSGWPLLGIVMAGFRKSFQNFHPGPSLSHHRIGWVHRKAIAFYLQSRTIDFGIVKECVIAVAPEEFLHTLIKMILVFTFAR